MTIQYRIMTTEEIGARIDHAAKLASRGGQDPEWQALYERESGIKARFTMPYEPIFDQPVRYNVYPRRVPSPEERAYKMIFLHTSARTTRARFEHLDESGEPIGYPWAQVAKAIRATGSLRWALTTWLMAELDNCNMSKFTIEVDSETSLS